MKHRLFTTLFIILTVMMMANNSFSVTDAEAQKIRQAMPDKPVVTATQPRTMLVFSLCNGFKHGCIPYWAKALDIMSEKTGAFKVVHSNDMSVFSPESLKKFDIICFNNTTKLVPDKSQQKAIMDFISSGKGIVGIHAATDNFYEWPEGAQMMGGVFTGHPWTSNGTWAVKLDEPTHPLMKPFKGQGFKINDEIYRTDAPLYSRKNQRVLMSLDMSDATTRNAKGVKPSDMDTGISWVKPVGKGRLFYCSLGHNNHLTWNTPVLSHYLAGIQYAAGDLEIDDAPLGEPSGAAVVAPMIPLFDKLAGRDWQQPRKDTESLKELIKLHSNDPQALKQIESKLLEILTSDATDAAKDFSGRQLAVIGTQQSVPVLSSLLIDPKLSNIARCALEKIDGNNVDQALAAAIGQTSDQNITIGLINSLGIRKSDLVVSVSQRLLKSSQSSTPAVQEAVLASLTFIGTEAAAKELMRIRPLLAGRAKARWADAMLACANTLTQNNQKSAAMQLYQTLMAAEQPAVMRAAAMQSFIKLNTQNAAPLLKQAFAGDDATMRTAAIQALPYMKNFPALLQFTASKAGTLPEASQVQLMSVMTETSPEIGRSLAVEMTRSEHEPARIAAFEALGKIGTPSLTELLAAGAAQARSRGQRDAARNALYQLSTEGVDEAIVTQIEDYKRLETDEKTVAELIKATAQRKNENAIQLLFRMANDDSQTVSNESVRALQLLAGPEYIEELVDLLASKPGTSTEKALLVAAGKIPNPNDRAMILLDKYPANAGNEKAQVSMLRVMGKLGDRHAIGLMRKELASSNAAISSAAFRAMTDWPGQDFTAEMKQQAQTGADVKTKVLAYRAYIRMVDASATEVNQSQIVEELINAANFAPQPDEQKRVISTLGNYGHPKAMAFVQKAAANPALKAEAEISLVRICEKHLFRDPAGVKALLQNLAASSESSSVKKQAAEVLKKVVDLDGVVLDWKISGPFSEKGKDGQALFDVKFAPEQSVTKGNWQHSLPFYDGNKSGILDLSKLDKESQRVAYLKTTLIADKAMPIMFEIGSDDGVKVWVNGVQVHANNASRAAAPGQDKAAVQLKKGNNPVLVKVTQGSGGWAFCLKITDANGKTISGVRANAGN